MQGRVTTPPVFHVFLLPPFYLRKACHRRRFELANSPRIVASYCQVISWASLTPRCAKPKQSYGAPFVPNWHIRGQKRSAVLVHGSSSDTGTPAREEFALGFLLALPVDAGAW